MVNKASGWSACKNLNRLATTLSNKLYDHTFAGLGGHHENGCGSWKTTYEAAPISSYCALIRGYGNDNNYVDIGGFDGGCRTSFKWVPIDIAVFIR